VATYLIGLTGNIASGKSLVLRRLEELGAYCLDADRLAHECLLPGHAAAQAVGRRFGAGVIAPDGQVDRAKLGDVVFSDSGALADLEAIIHPWVIAEIERRLAEARPAVAAIEAIKLIESSLGARCQSVWVVTCASERQVERLRRDRGLSRAQALLRVEAQTPAGIKVQRADVLLENDGSTAELLAKVDEEWGEIQAGTAPGMAGGPAPQ
jgi:dephospho-CoA kinase